MLDELRENLRAVWLSEFHAWMDYEAVFDAFEADHPGLVDQTSRCDFCGKPLPTDENGCVDWNTTPLLAWDDGSPMYGCPICAQEDAE